MMVARFAFLLAAAVLSILGATRCVLARCGGCAARGSARGGRRARLFSPVYAPLVFGSMSATIAATAGNS